MSKEKISKRPASMPNINSHLLPILRWAKLLLTLPRPVPELANAARIAENAVTKSLPNAIKVISRTKNRPINTEINAHMDCKTGSGQVIFPNLIGVMACG